MRTRETFDILKKNALWTIPAEREELQEVKHSNCGSKMKTFHLVPLSDMAIVILREIQKTSSY